MSKIPWKLIWAFCLPLNFAIGSFYKAHLIMNGKTDCRKFTSITVDCADRNTLFWYDFFGFGGFFLVVAALALPFIVSFLTKRDSETDALQKIS